MEAKDKGLVVEGEEEEEEEIEVENETAEEEVKKDLSAQTESDKAKVVEGEDEEEEEKETETEEDGKKGQENHEPKHSIEATDSTPPTSGERDEGLLSSAFASALLGRVKRADSVGDKSLRRANQNVRTMVGSASVSVIGASHRAVLQTSHALDLVRNVAQELSGNIHNFNADIEKLSVMLDAGCECFLVMLQPPSTAIPSG